MMTSTSSTNRSSKRSNNCVRDSCGTDFENIGTGTHILTTTSSSMPILNFCKNDSNRSRSRVLNDDSKETTRLDTDDDMNDDDDDDDVADDSDMINETSCNNDETSNNSKKKTLSVSFDDEAIRYTNRRRTNSKSNRSLWKQRRRRGGKINKSKHAATGGISYSPVLTKAVRKLKFAYIALLIATAIVASVVVHYFLTRSEQAEFDTQFDHLATQIIDKLRLNALSKFVAIDSLALQIETYALTMNVSNNTDTNSTQSPWPFVTIPYFEAYVASMEILTDAYAVQLFPIVTKDKRQQWEEYSVQNNWWINASYATQQGHSNREPQPTLESMNTTTWFDALWPGSIVSGDPPNFEKYGGGMSDSIFITTKTPDDVSNLTKVPIRTNNPYYLPQWQTAPISWYYQSTINYDYADFSDFITCAEIASTYKTACIGIAWTDETAPSGYLTTLMYPVFDKFRNPTTASTVTDTGNEYDVEQPNVVALLAVDIYWESYLENILPQSAKKVYVVVEYECEDAAVFTYSIDGNDCVYIPTDELDGESGDFHEVKYDKFKRTTRFGSNLYENEIQKQNEQGLGTNMYTGRSLYDGFCQYDFSIYPSQELENEYVTNKPMWYTIFVAMIFCFALALFVVYDCLVERRQRLVFQSALLSDHIVSTLFPTNVKQRLYNDTIKSQEFKEMEKLTSSSQHPKEKQQPLPQATTTTTTVAALQNETKEEMQQSDKHNGEEVKESTSISILPRHERKQNSVETDSESLLSSSAHSIQASTWTLSPKSKTSFVRRNSYKSSSEDDKMSQSPTGTKRLDRSGIIAEKHPETTVLFADIVGFTEWSSNREPNDVFILLETIYSSFDELAIRRKVFKIETIGDCYVAVTGLPTQQVDHAIIMTQFAIDMLQILQFDLQTIIGPQLGSDSLSLAMRVGMHSGPVIAGVLRGNKARFQLFGDTMNTAARMESNGQPNCIHLSQTTADLLSQAGKEHWIYPRADLVYAKGKGRMQTYWVRLGENLVQHDTHQESSDSKVEVSSSDTGNHFTDQQKAEDIEYSNDFKIDCT